MSNVSFSFSGIPDRFSGCITSSIETLFRRPKFISSSPFSSASFGTAFAEPPPGDGLRTIDRLRLQRLDEALHDAGTAQLSIADVARAVGSNPTTLQWLARQEQREKLEAVFQGLMKEDTFHHSITAIFR